MAGGTTSGDVIRIDVSIEYDPSRKREIQRNLTASLPEWFGDAEANRHYASQAEILTGYVARLDGNVRGMLLLKAYGRTSIEIYWLGVDPDRHRLGVGRALVDAACTAAQADGVKFVFVSTLHPRESYAPYQRTLQFYEAMGFRYVLEEQMPKDRNPLAYFIRQLG